MSDAALSALLAAGGDDRLALDAAGRNLYGHPPAPVHERAFGSSTASTISAPAFAALRPYHADLVRAIETRGAAVACRDAAEAIRADLRTLIGCPAGVEIVLSPSGTDVHLLAVLLAHADRPLLTITLEGSETGSSIAAAAGGAHYMPHAPSGATVAPGVPLCVAIANRVLAARDPFDGIRDEAEIEAELDSVIATAIADGRDCLLVVTDVSKTGLIAPGIDTALRLAARHGDRLTVLVDACQLRLAPATLSAYLALGMPVAITGSKFLGGPVFSGALLCPPGLAARLRTRRLPEAATDYSCAADWPAGWAAADVLGVRVNPGVLLRWQAALHEWRALRAIPQDRITAIVAGFARAVETRLRRDSAFETIASRPLDRRALALGGSFDTLPTIFPFLLARADPLGRRARLLSVEETRAIHRDLAARGVRLGQPVACGQRLGAPVAALRLCISARLIVDAGADEDGFDRLLDSAMVALDTAALLAACSASPIARAA